MRKAIAVSLAALLLASYAPSAFAATYFGPSFNVSPAAVVSGATVQMQLSSGSGSTFTAPPGGSALCNILNPSTCSFQLQACTSLNYYQINQATVTDPNGNAYLLGSAVTSGLANNHIPSPRLTSAGFAPAINVSATDSGSIPFGTGVGGFFALTSNLPNPPNNVNPEGPYYWWTVAGNTNGANLRLDQNPSIQPTAPSGTYVFDLEGLVFCGSFVLFFDAVMEFVVGPSIGGATRTIGWWQTHLAFEQSTWAAYIAANPGGANICGLTVTTAAQAIGGMWASVSKLTDGTKRDGVSQAEMILVQQWIGALLNTQAFGTSDGGLLAAGQAACNTDNVNTITLAAGGLDIFNGSGETVAVSGAGSATPQAAMAFANVAFWDNV